MTTTHYKCIHLQNEERPFMNVVKMYSHASNLKGEIDTETLCCPICSGLLVWVLQRIETPAGFELAAEIRQMALFAGVKR